jgi:hypothetical protein
MTLAAISTLFMGGVALADSTGKTTPPPPTPAQRQSTRVRPATAVWQVLRQRPKLRALKADLVPRAEPIPRTKWLPTQKKKALRGLLRAEPGQELGGEATALPHVY